MKNFLIHTLLFWLFLLLLAATFSSCKPTEDDQSFAPISDEAGLTEALTQIQQSAQLPGFAVSIVKDDAVVYQQAFGHADIGQDRAYTNTSVQPIGSISKTFIGAALMKAIEQGFFTLDTDINEILPFTVQHPTQPNAPIKVRHLATHTAGLLDDYDHYLAGYYLLPGEDLTTQGAQLMQEILGSEQRSATPLATVLKNYFHETGTYYDPDHFTENPSGTQWAYSNLGASLCAYLIEVATGQSFADYTREQIFLPLGMTHTTFQPTENSHAATLYWDQDVPLPRYGNDSYPDGSVTTSNEDLAKYLLEMIRGFQGTAQTLFPKAIYDQLFDPRLPAGMIPAAIGNNQGIFWFWEGDKLRHDGSDPGTSCILEFDTSDNTGYLLLTNADASTEEHEAHFIQTATRIQEAIFSFLGKQ